MASVFSRSSSLRSCQENLAIICMLTHGKQFLASQAMERHGVKIQVSQAKTAPGHGVFAARELAPGVTIAAKGPWFRSVEELEAWLSSSSLDFPVAQALSKKVVEVWVKGADGNVVPHYKVLTSVVGFVNCSSGISQRPNAVLRWNPDVPLGEHSLELRITQTVPMGKELTIAYGPKHPCVPVRQQRKPMTAQRDPARPVKRPRPTQ